MERVSISVAALRLPARRRDANCSVTSGTGGASAGYRDDASKRARTQSGKETLMSGKHPKTTKPSDRDLDENPLIGGSKGTTMAGLSPDDLDDLQGANTIEGDLENDTTPQGGIDKAASRSGRPTSRK